MHVKIQLIIRHKWVYPRLANKRLKEGDSWIHACLTDYRQRTKNKYAVAVPYGDKYIKVYSDNEKKFFAYRQSA